MGWLSDLLKEYPALSVAKERLLLAEEKFKKVEIENSELKERIKRLSQQNELLRSRLDKEEQYPEKYGVRWDENYKMRCIYCKEILKNSTQGKHIFYCADPNCNNKHVLRNDDDEEMSRREAKALMMQNSK